MPQHRHGRAVSLVIFGGEKAAQRIPGQLRIAVSQLIPAGKDGSCLESNSAFRGISPNESKFWLVAFHDSLYHAALANSLDQFS